MQNKTILKCLTTVLEEDTRTKNLWAATWQNHESEYALSEDSDQPGHPPSLIRVFAVRLMGS